MNIIPIGVTVTPPIVKVSAAGVLLVVVVAGELLPTVDAVTYAADATLDTSTIPPHNVSHHDPSSFVVSVAFFSAIFFIP